MNYTTHIENAGRHRLLLNGDLKSDNLKDLPLASLDAKEIRSMLARHLYKSMKQRPAFIFVYDRQEDFNHPQGFSVARLHIGIDADKYLIEVRDRSGLEMPTPEDFDQYDAYQAELRLNPDYEADSDSIMKCFEFLYMAPVIRFEVTA
jgi:hypothetical protein